MKPESKTGLTYGKYLQLERLLSAQSEVSGSPGKSAAHDETLFIIVHQSHELWFKQILHELGSVISMCGHAPVKESTIGLATLRLERIAVILELLGDHLKVLETMTPMDFLEFRNHLSPASGFQSVQFRIFEARLGMPKTHLENLKKGFFGECLTESDRDALDDALSAPSLLEVMNAWLERTPFLQTEEFNFWSAYRDAIESHLARDHEMVREQMQLGAADLEMRFAEIERTRQAFMDLFDEEKHKRQMESGDKRLSLRANHAALFIYSYRDQPILHAPFRLLTQLTRIDELLSNWRAGHAQMVHRMIGIKVGTGGSSGYEYLRSTLATHSVFRDLIGLSTFMLPRSSLPELPKEFIPKLGFMTETPPVDPSSQSRLD